MRRQWETVKGKLLYVREVARYVTKIVIRCVTIGTRHDVISTWQWIFFVSYKSKYYFCLTSVWEIIQMDQRQNIINTISVISLGSSIILSVVVYILSATAVGQIPNPQFKRFLCKWALNIINTNLFFSAYCKRTSDSHSTGMGFVRRVDRLVSHFYSSKFP